jgi:hypothetical protein
VRRKLKRENVEEKNLKSKLMKFPKIHEGNLYKVERITQGPIMINY